MSDSKISSLATMSALTGTELLTGVQGGSNTNATPALIKTYITQAGASSGHIGISGNLTTQVSAAGISPANTGGDYVLATYTLPASVFDIAGRKVRIEAVGQYASNGDTKEIKIYVGCTSAMVGSTVSGGTAIADSGGVTASGTGWRIAGCVLKYGAAASNTQLGFQDNSSTSAALPQALTLVEANTCIIAITGNATTTASDIVFNGLEVSVAN